MGGGPAAPAPCDAGAAPFGGACDATLRRALAAAQEVAPAAPAAPQMQQETATAAAAAHQLLVQQQAAALAQALRDGGASPQRAPLAPEPDTAQPHHLPAGLPTLHYPGCGCPPGQRSQAGAGADALFAAAGAALAAGTVAPSRKLRVAYVLPHHNTTGGMKVGTRRVLFLWIVILHTCCASHALRCGLIKLGSWRLRKRGFGALQPCRLPLHPA